MPDIKKEDTISIDEFRKRIDNRSTYKKVYYSIYRGIHKVLDFPKEVKWFLQRKVRGYSDDDLWSLDYALGKHILKCLKAFKKTNRYGVPTEFIYNKGKKDRSVEEGEKLWSKELQEMIDGFDYLTYHDEYEELPPKELSDAERVVFYKKQQDDYKKAQEKAKKLIIYFGNLWD